MHLLVFIFNIWTLTNECILFIFHFSEPFLQWLLTSCQWFLMDVWSQFSSSSHRCSRVTTRLVHYVPLFFCQLPFLNHFKHYYYYIYWLIDFFFFFFYFFFFLKNICMCIMLVILACPTSVVLIFLTVSKIKSVQNYLYFDMICWNTIYLFIWIN